MQLEGSRQGSGLSLGLNLLKTLAQCVVVWGVFLWFIPLLFVKLEMVASIANFQSSKWSELGLLIFMACSTVFLICVWSIVWLGRGTPWPWDRSTDFVVVGPYRYVRNPLVIAGIGQGLAAGLIVGSYLVLLYVAVGVAIWNFVLRPIEEADLAHRFGRSYIDYFQSIHAWLPSLRPYRSMIIASVEDSNFDEDAF